MAYCVISDVRAIVDSNMTDTEIEGIIDECGALITAKIGSSAAPLVLRAINRTWAAYRVMQKDPDSMSLGELRYDRSASMKQMREDYTDWLNIGGGGIATKYKSEPIR